VLLSKSPFFFFCFLCRIIERKEEVAVIVVAVVIVFVFVADIHVPVATTLIFVLFYWFL
jgi:hypothetical protein